MLSFRLKVLQRTHRHSSTAAWTATVGGTTQSNLHNISTESVSCSRDDQHCQGHNTFSKGRHADAADADTDAT